jgi:hypothetical protein
LIAQEPADGHDRVAIDRQGRFATERRLPDDGPSKLFIEDEEIHP